MQMSWLTSVDLYFSWSRERILWFGDRVQEFVLLVICFFRTGSRDQADWKAPTSISLGWENAYFWFGFFVFWEGIHTNGPAACCVCVWWHVRDWDLIYLPKRREGASWLKSTTILFNQRKRRPMGFCWGGGRNSGTCMCSFVRRWHRACWVIAVA